MRREDERFASLTNIGKLDGIQRTLLEKAMEVPTRGEV